MAADEHDDRSRRDETRSFVDIDFRVRLVPGSPVIDVSAKVNSMAFGQRIRVLFPGLAIAVAVLGLNLIGDGLRDVLDPRLRRLAP